MQDLRYGQLSVFVTESNTAVGEAGANEFSVTAEQTMTCLPHERGGCVS